MTCVSCLIRHEQSTDFSTIWHHCFHVFPYQRNTQLVPELSPEHPNSAKSPSLCPSGWPSLRDYAQQTIISNGARVNRINQWCVFLLMKSEKRFTVVGHQRRQAWNYYCSRCANSNHIKCKHTKISFNINSLWCFLDLTFWIVIKLDATNLHAAIR